MRSVRCSSAISKLNEQSTEEFGFGQKSRLTKAMVEAIRMHLSGLAGVNLSLYNFERLHSDYPRRSLSSSSMTRKSSRSSAAASLTTVAW